MYGVLQKGIFKIYYAVDFANLHAIKNKTVFKVQKTRGACC